MGTTEHLDVDGSSMPLYVAKPASEGPHAGAIVMHHRPGIDDFTRDRCDRLAALGVFSVAPGLYHRQPADRDTQEAKEYLVDDEIAADIGAALERLKSDPSVDNARIAILGHCQGGRTTAIGLGHYGDFRAGCIYYGGSSFVRLGGDGPTPFDLMKNWPCPVMGFFGGKDRNPSPEDVARMDDELTRLGKPHEFVSYADAGHAFQDHTAPRYCAGPADDAWGKTIAFLQRELAL